jgi:hypothetical protein
MLNRKLIDLPVQLSKSKEFFFKYSTHMNVLNIATPVQILLHLTQFADLSKLIKRKHQVFATVMSFYKITAPTH